MKKIFFVIILINKIYFNEGTWNVPSVEIEPKDSTCKNRNIFIGHFSYTCIDVCPFSEYSYDSASLKDINIICNGQDQYFSKDLLLEYFYSLYNGMHQCNFAISPYEDNFNFIATFIIINKTDSFQFDFDEVSILFTTYSFSITRNQNSNKYTYEEGSWVMLIVTKKYIKKSERKGEIKIKIKKDEFGYNYTTLQNNIKIVMKKVPVEETQIKISYIRFVALYNIKNLQNYEWYMDEQGHPNFDKNCKCANNNQYDTPTQTYPYKRSELKFVGPVPFFYDDLIDDVQSNDCLVMLNTTHYKITSVYEQGFRIYSPERAITDTSLLTKWISSPEYNIINVNVINKATVCSNDYVLVVRLVVSIQSIRVYTDNKTLYEIVCSPQYGCSSRWSGTLGFTIRDSKCKKIAIQLTRRSSDNTLPVAFINKISTFTNPNLTCTNFYKDLNQRTYGQILSNEILAQDDNIYSHNPYNICFSPINYISTNVSIIDGGRIITFGGRVDNFFHVKIGDQKCIMISENKNNSACIAPKNTNLKLNVTKLYLIHKHTNIVYDFYEFEYVKNPNITHFYPRNVTISGGLKMHINGTGFSNVGRIMLICHIYQFYEYKERVESKCQVESDENLLCFTPNLEHVDWNNSNLSINNEINNKQVDTSDILNIRKKRQINDFRIIYGVTFDNFEFYLNISKTFPKILFYHIFQDPIIYEFENGYKTFYNFGNWIDEFFEISGDRLNIGNISDYTVKLNQNTINIAEKFSNKLIVIPNFENYETCVNQDVIVSFGNINTHVGKLKIYQSIRCHTVWLSVVIIIPIFVVLIIIIIIICIQKRKTPRAGHVTELSYDITQLSYYHLPKVYSETVPELIDELKKYDLPSNKLTLYDNIIGSGAYGCVYIGIYDKIKVALKTPKESTPTFVENFMIESSIMAKLSGGNYILKQIGVTVINNRIYSVTPYMNCGDLNNYLKANSNIEIHILFKFMTAIAEGMHYISTKMYVHRDLATRNCLVHNYETVYISDFGLCKELDETGNYISFDHQEKMPLFWCALECLNKHIFNEKSDVWSYGVLVWELFSKGNRPYSDLKDVRQYKKFIEDSHRLKKPKKCPEATYNLMKRCWHQNGDERPSFLNIINSMRKDDYYILPQKI